MGGGLNIQRSFLSLSFRLTSNIIKYVRKEKRSFSRSEVRAKCLFFPPLPQRKRSRTAITVAITVFSFDVPSFYLTTFVSLRKKRKHKDDNCTLSTRERDVFEYYRNGWKDTTEKSVCLVCAAVPLRACSKFCCKSRAGERKTRVKCEFSRDALRFDNSLDIFRKFKHTSLPRERNERASRRFISRWIFAIRRRRESGEKKKKRKKSQT